VIEGIVGTTILDGTLLRGSRLLGDGRAVCVAPLLNILKLLERMLIVRIDSERLAVHFIGVIPLSKLCVGISQSVVGAGPVKCLGFRGRRYVTVSLADFRCIPSPK
jgi:hypothetical protein